MSSFAVVDFVEEGTVEVISTKWLSPCRRVCFWPSSAGPKVTSLVKKHAVPGTDWDKYNCRVLKTTGKFFYSCPIIIFCMIVLRV
jgi:hypothetical protein